MEGRPRAAFFRLERGRQADGSRRPSAFRCSAERARRSLALRRLRWAAAPLAEMCYCCVEGVADSLLKLACWAPSTCASAESPESRPSCSPKTRTVTSCPHLVRLWWVCLLRLSAALLVRGAAPLIDTANLASNHASDHSANLCRPASRSYP